MDNYYVEIVAFHTGEIVKSMGPMSEWKAEKVEAGAQRNLDSDRYFTRIVRQ